MCSPAALCRFLSGSLLVPLYRDIFSTTVASNLSMRGCFVTTPQGYITVSKVPKAGEIVFTNTDQYVCNIRENYQIRQLTPFGQRLYKASQYIESIDDGNSWIFLTGLIVIIAAVILLPALKTAAEILQWTAIVLAALAGLAVLANQRWKTLHQPS